MELNDQVKVTLTAYGASVLNEDNKQWKERYPKAFSSEKTDYKEGDIYENQLWCILGRFTDSFQAGRQIPFTDLAKVEKLNINSSN